MRLLLCPLCIIDLRFEEEMKNRQVIPGLLFAKYVCTLFFEAPTEILLILSLPKRIFKKMTHGWTFYVQWFEL